MNVSVNRLIHQRTTSSGFTLIELMVTIAVLAIIVSIAAPSISNQLANQRVKSTVSTIENALKEAKVESIIRRQPITVTFANNNSDGGTISLTDTANIASHGYDAKSKIGATNTLTGTVATTIIFRSSKHVDAGLTYTICDSNSAASPRQVVVSTVAIITSRLGGTCP